MPERIGFPAPLAVLAAVLLVAVRVGADELTLVQNGQPGLSAVGRKALGSSPDGAHVYASSQDLLITLRRQSDGTLAFVAPAFSLVGDPLYDPEGLTVSPDGGHVYVAGSGGLVAVFSRSSQTGALTGIPAEDETEELAGSSSALAPSPDGAWLYVTSPAGDRVVVYGRDAASGALTFVQKIQEGDGGVSGLDGARRVVTSPDGAHVYVGGRTGGAAAIVVLRRGLDGTLTFVEREREGEEDVTGLGDVAALAVAPDGSEVLALSTTPIPTPRIVRFARDGDSGALAFREAVLLVDENGDALTFASGLGWLAFRPDGRRLYLSPLAPTATLAYARDATGALALVGQSTPGTSGLAGVSSPDGRYVYTTTGVPVRVFAPEPAAGVAVPVALLALALRRRVGSRARPACATSRA
jgi:6-phosphogluconolactonase (cycloisomerase 2 family)